MRISFGPMFPIAAPIGLLACAVLLADPAVAHHPTGGMTPQTLWHGLLSGIGHPIIGLDHLSFIVATGIAAAFLSGGMTIPVGFIVASAIGVFVHLAKVDVPMVEAIVAASVIVAGLALAMRLPLRAIGWTALATIAGFFHGYAFGESIVGAEQGVIAAYVAGLAIVAIVIAVVAKFATQALLLPTTASSARLRGAGAVLSCLGVVFLTMALRAA